MASSNQEDSIIRPALGRNYSVGSFYSTVNDRFINPETSAYCELYIKSHQFTDIHSCSMEYGKVLEDKIKLLEAQSDLYCSLITDKSFIQNRFNKFLNDEKYQFGDEQMKKAAFKIDFSCCNKSIDLNKNNSLTSQNMLNKDFLNNLYVVTEVTFGIQIVGILWFMNERNLEDGDIKKALRQIVESLSQKNLDFSYLNDNIRKNIKVDFFDNVNQYPYSSLDFDSFIFKFDSLLKSNFGQPIQYKMISYIFLKNRSHTIRANLDFAFDFYNSFNQRVSSLLDKWHEIDAYSNYFETSKKDGVKRTLHELYKLIDFVKSSLRKEVTQIRKYPKSTFESINKLIVSANQKIKCLEESWKAFEPSRIQLQDIKFFKKNANLIYIESSWDRKEIELKNGFILCYSSSLKEKNKDQWKRCLGEFMSLMHEKQDEFSFYVLNFDICKPLNFDCFNQIQIMKIENGLLNSISITNAVCENKETTPMKRIEETNNKEEFNIVLLGETGVGKSTFVNAFANYLKFQSLKEALNAQSHELLIESHFYYTDDNFETRKIQAGEVKNETFIEGQSSTQSAQEYTFLLDNHKIIRIIDTPGMGDSRGHLIDKKNFDETIEFLSKFKHINAICFLVKPNNPRLHAGFRYCFKELLSHLHKNTTSNIVFCFTNTRSTQYRPGETFGALDSFLKEVGAESNVRIQFDKDNIFCVDNEGFRNLMLKSHGVEFSDNEQSNFANSWKNSSENSRKMLQYIMTNLRALETKQIIILNNLRQFNSGLATNAVQLLKSMILKRYDLSNEKKEFSLKNLFTEDHKRKTKLESKLESDLKELIDRVIFICSKLSNLMRVNSLAVFNDDFEAYLADLLKESKERINFTDEKKYEEISDLFKETMNKFIKSKKQIEDDLKLKKLTFKENDVHVLADELYRIEEEFNKGNFF